MGTDYETKLENQNSELRQTIARQNEGLKEAKELMAQFKEFEEQVKQGPVTQATILYVDSKNKRLGVAQDNGVVLLPVIPPEHRIIDEKNIGKTVNVCGKFIVGLSDFPDVAGSEASLIKVDGNEFVVESGEGVRRLTCRVPSKEVLEAGDKLLLDSSGLVIRRKLESTKVENSTGITWDSIGGLEDAKAQMVEAIELPVTRADLFEAYGKRQAKGVLLFGPPGCGKTMLGKAAATSMAKLSKGKSNESGFIYVKGPEVLSKWVGEAEASIRSLFARARAFHKKTGIRAVIFIDEAEALLHSRTSKHATSGIQMTVVPSFLAEMDGLEDSGAMVLLSTNRPDSLDPAIVRDGRIDKKIQVPRPGLKEAEDILHHHLKGVPVAFDATPKEVAKQVASVVYGTTEDQLVFNVNTKQGPKAFYLHNLASGAMLANIVEEAKSRAMQRDIKSKSKKVGVLEADFEDAVRSSCEQQKFLNHEETIENFRSQF